MGYLSFPFVCFSSLCFLAQDRDSRFPAMSMPSQVCHVTGEVSRLLQEVVEKRV